MKKFFTLLLLVACVVMVQAQKIDSQLMQLVGQQANRAQSVMMNRKALQDVLSVSLNADGSIKSVPVIGYLQQGAECPVEQLEPQGHRHLQRTQICEQIISIIIN